MLLAQVSRDSQNVPYLGKPSVFYSTDSSVWDFVTLKKEQQIIAVLDSGKAERFDLSSQ